MEVEREKFDEREMQIKEDSQKTLRFYESIKGERNILKFRNEQLSQQNKALLRYLAELEKSKNKG